MGGMEIDCTSFLGSVKRSVESRDHDGQPARVIALTRTFNTDQNDLWDAVTNIERIPRWFLPITGTTALGGRYQLEGNAEGQVLHCDPQNRFEITWEYAGYMSWVHVTLTPSESGTSLKLEHIAPILEDDSFWEEYGPGAGGVGWDGGLLGLDLYLSLGQAFDRQQVETWSASPQGLDFYTQSSELWGEADLAYGTPPEAARAATDKTIAFYTGQPEEDPDQTE